MATWSGARPNKEKDEGKASLPNPFSSSSLVFCMLLFPSSHMLHHFSFQKLHPKKNQPWRAALQREPPANRTDVDKLARKLQNTTLV